MNLALLLQMSTRDPMFWIMVIIAASFVFIAVAMIALAVSGHLSTATGHVSESLAVIKSEIIELKELVSDTAVQARDKVELVSRTIDRTHQQVAFTTDYVQSKVIEPAREIAAIMAGFRRGLEVLVAPMPKPINQTYAEDEMFIG